MQKSCWQNAASTINVVRQNLTSNGFLKMRHLETGNPNACQYKCTAGIKRNCMHPWNNPAYLNHCMELGE
jgi:hypothetical protein